MLITITRNRFTGEVAEGKLFIDALYICDTLENSRSCLSSGF